jgi:UDP-N-acetyl-D-mannosaminuronic acid dehydrogenase
MMSISKESLDSFEKRHNYTVSIIECGRLGTPHACLFADAGFRVIGVNTNPHNLEMLKTGQTPFHRTAFRALERHAKEGLFSVSPDIRKSVSESNIIIITIQTPSDSRKKPDYSLLERACKEVGMGLRKGSLVIFASPTGPGVAQGSMVEIMENASGLRAGSEFALASGFLQHNTGGEKSSVVVGAVNEPSRRSASTVFGSIANLDILNVSSIRTAEALNLFQNVKREILHASSNEFASLCERLKIDFLEILKTINAHGGSLIPPPGLSAAFSRKDLYLLKEEAENVGFDLRLTDLASRINDEVVESTFHLVKNALKACGKTVRGSKVSVLGISKSSNAKDPPTALTKSIVTLLRRKVRVVQVYDPYFSKKELAALGFNGDLLSRVVEKTDCLLILTGHSKFARLNLRKVKLVAKKSPALVDISHVVDPSKAEQCGFVYRGLGRGVWTK